MFRITSWVAASVVVGVAAFAGGCSNSAPPISVTLSPSSSQAIDQGETVSIGATVANDRFNKGVTWALSGPGLLSSDAGPSVTYTPPSPVLSSAQQVTIAATSVADPMESASVQITVNPYLQIPINQSLPNGTVGAPYNESISVMGGTPPYQWSVYDGPIDTGWEVGGAVPNGLTLDPATGAVSGTPTGGGTWYFEATVTDATGAAAADGFLSIEIYPSALAGNSVPFLNQPLVPTAVSPGSSAFTLSVSGTGFGPGATVDFNGKPLTTTYVDNEHLSAAVPASDVANATTAAITVANPGPGGGQSNIVYFQAGAPEVTVSFANAPNSPLQVYSPSGLAASDFNEDGNADIAVAGSIKVYVYLGNGNGTFATAPGSPLNVPSPPYADAGSPDLNGIATGDFNHSGHTGLAVGLFQDEAAAIFFGNGNGTFGSSNTLANTSGMYTNSLTAGDFNSDGNLDLVAVNFPSGSSPVVLLGSGEGAFNEVPQNANLRIEGNSSAAGDFNGDGKLDLTVDGANVLLGNGDGTFTQAPPAPADTNGYGVVVADFNGDGKLDIAVCNNTTNTVTVLLGNGDGTFTPASSSPIPVGNTPEAIVAGDFNNDGKLDLAIANYGDNTVTLLLGNGDGTFTEAVGSPYAVGQGPYEIVAADFNGDGKLDLAVANITDGTVSILLQQ